jgi:hypothetical protein
MSDVKRHIGTMPDGSQLLVVDWGDDGPLQAATRPHLGAMWSAPIYLTPSDTKAVS